MSIIQKFKKIIARHQQRLHFKNSAQYWETRYAKGGNSGRGSYGRHAEYKASFLNEFIIKEQISSITEFGCGDGNQLLLAVYPKYTGLDVSRSVITNCIRVFKNDKTKNFFFYDQLAWSDRTGLFSADLVLSLDVVYHLVEDEVFFTYMNNLFDSSKKFVIIYAWDLEGEDKVHVKHRKFTDWISKNKKNWKLKGINPGIEKMEAACDFFVFEKLLLNP